MRKHSPRFQLNKEDAYKLAKGGTIAMAGALLAYIARMAPLVDWGEQYTPLVVAGLSIIVNLFRKWLQGQR